MSTIEFPYKFEQSLTHVMPITTADATRLGAGVALYYNPRKVLGPDHGTLALGRVAGKLLDDGRPRTVYEAGVGTGAFLISAAMSSAKPSDEICLTGNDINQEAILTTYYNLSELRRRTGIAFIAEITKIDWEEEFAHPERTSPDQGIIHFNPPYKRHGDNLGTADATLAPENAIYGLLGEQGIPQEYARYLLPLYRRLSVKGAAFIRLPPEYKERKSFKDFIFNIQQSAFDELGLRYCELSIDIPEKTPTSWEDTREKQFPYRTASGLLVSRELPKLFADNMHPYADEGERVIYEDIQYRFRANVSSEEKALLRI